MPRNKPDHKTTTPFVVVVRFPSSSREYSYFCDIPGIKQGSHVIANGVRVEVIRTATTDPSATRFVRPCPDAAKIAREARIGELRRELNTMYEEQQLLERFAKLKSPAAKRCFAELKRLINQQ